MMSSNTATPPGTTPPHTIEIQVDDAVKRVSQKGREWRSLPIDKKISLLEQVIANAVEHKKEWVACHQSHLKIGEVGKKMNPDHGYAMFDILARGPLTFGGYAHGILRSMKHIKKTKNGTPPPPVSTRTVKAKSSQTDIESNSNDKMIATVWPSPWSLIDSLEAFGMKAEMVCDVVDLEKLQYTQAEFIDEQNQNQAKNGDESNVDVVCAAILAAGNFDAPTDLLCELFIKGRVCIYKPNPINEASIPVLKKILKPVLDLGYAEFSPSTSMESAKVLVQNEGIQEIVLTGSKATLDSIKWGNSKEEQEKNKANQTPINVTPLCSELGAVTPWIVVPGPQWTKRSIEDHARAMVFAKLANNGHICVAPQVIIWPKNWEHRQLFRERIEYWMAKHPGTVPFYPGSGKTHEALRQHPNSKLIPFYGNSASRASSSGKRPEPIFPEEQRPIFISDMLLESERDQKLFQQEAWCPVLMELPIDVEDAKAQPMEYLRQAVDVAKSNLYGSLSINILVDNKTVKRNRKELDHIIAHEMPYGLVGINVWPCYANSLSQLRWGAFVRRDDSGSGSLANAHLYRNVEKTVLRAPFWHLPRRALQVMNPKKAHLVFSRFATYKLKPNLVTQVGLFAALFLGV